jgi:hypothetical protein
MKDYFAALFPEGVTGVTKCNIPLKPSEIAMNDEKKPVTLTEVSRGNRSNKSVNTLHLVTPSRVEGGILQPSKIAALPLLHLVTPHNDEELIYSFEERAAIMEFDGGLSRSEAERLAKTDVETNLNGGRNHESTN